MIALESRKALVLNKNWAPINTTTLKKAFSKVINGRAKIVHPSTFQPFSWEDWSKIRPENEYGAFSAGGQDFMIPEIIVLVDYDKVPSPKTHFSRRTLFKRDNHTCQYCGTQPGTELLTVDHVIPRSKGGQTTWENCVAACVDCNSKKANLSVQEAKMKLRTVPKKPRNTFFRNETYVLDSWGNFLDIAYWNVALE